jgi:hypothetical protein
MRETVFNFRFQLRRKNEKLISCTKDIRRKLRTTQSQLHLLVDERAELTAKVSNVPKSLYRSHAGSHFYGTEDEIWAGFGPIDNIEKNWGRRVCYF